MNNREEFVYKAEKADREDILKRFRSYFRIDKKLIYFDGNSLGMMPLRSEKVANELISH